MFNQYEQIIMDYPSSDVDDGFRWLHDLKDVPRQLSLARFTTVSESRGFFKQMHRRLIGGLRCVRDSFVREHASVSSADEHIIALHINTDAMKDSFAKYFLAMSSGACEDDPVFICGTLHMESNIDI